MGRKSEIRTVLSGLVEQELSVLGDDLRLPVEVVDVLGSLVRSPAGYVRGRLIVAAYEAVRGRFPPPRVRRIAALYEVFHLAILIHDDLVDRSSSRRGLPSCHEALGGGAKGRAGALLTGDVLLVHAIGQLALTLGSGAAGRAVYQELLCGALRTGGGVLRTWSRAGDLCRYDEQEAHDSLLNESGWYSVVLPLRIGAGLAVASASHLYEWEQVGIPAGVGFQLLDECRDVPGDLEGGKRGIIVTRAFQSLQEQDAAELAELVASSSLSPLQRRRLTALVQSSGVITSCRDEALGLFARARRVLDAMDLYEEGRARVLEIFEHMKGSS